MNDHQRCLCVGLSAIICAGLFRFAEAAPRIQPNTAEAVIERETGQNVRFSASYEVFSPEFPAESGAAAPKAAPEKPRYTILPGFRNTTNHQPPLQQLLEEPLAWQLRGRLPTVLILHTHATESYTKTDESYEESAAWRTLDPEYNMLSVSRYVETLLEAEGIGVIRDLELHDYPSYNGSYAHARQSLTALLEENPGICLVLDLHRDAADAPGGGQLRTTAALGDRVCAQLMPVMGAGFENYTENLALALKLCAQLEQQVPGITRPIQLRSATFNQDLCSGALLIEVGAAGNTREEALLAAEQLALAIIALADGTA